MTCIVTRFVTRKICRLRTKAAIGLINIEILVKTAKKTNTYKKAYMKGLRN